jgi:hypothetical protein
MLVDRLSAEKALETMILDDVVNLPIHIDVLA